MKFWNCFELRIVSMHYENGQTLAFLTKRGLNIFFSEISKYLTENFTLWREKKCFLVIFWHCFLSEKNESIDISFPAICAAMFRKIGGNIYPKYQFSSIVSTCCKKENPGTFLKINFCLLPPLRTKAIYEYKEPAVISSKFWH